MNMSTTVRLDKKNVYLDNSAATPIDARVLDIMIPYFGDDYGNPSSLHASGRKSLRVIEESRRRVASVLSCNPEEIIFTGSGTESDNLALLGIARANKSHGRHIIISSIEHKAVIESTRLLEREGFEISIAPVLESGIIDMEQLAKLLRKDTILVSIMYANNEIGTIEPISEISTLIKKYRGDSMFPVLHTDACQAVGLLSLDVRELGADLVTLNSAKAYGPKGVGVLYKKKNLYIDPIIVGGEQERSLRAGTQNLPAIVGFAEALHIAEQMRTREVVRLKALRDYFIDRVRVEIPEAHLNGHSEKRLPNNAHFSFPNVEGESILLMLDNAGVEVSTGSACSSLDLRPSHVLLALGRSSELAYGSIRFSLGRHTTQKELDYVLSVLPEIINKLDSFSVLKNML